jgi:predicted DCC family thiol-disulfide oxidoreductase YuxK
MSALKSPSVDSQEQMASLQPTWKIKLLYDGQCPLCLREVKFLTQKDAGRGIVAFVDIADLSYTPEEHGNIEFAEAMGRIHAVLPDGIIIRDVEVFRRVYDALGMGWIYAATRWPAVRPVVDAVYQLWAHWRLALTGRPNLSNLVVERQNRLNENNVGRCRLTQTDEGTHSCNP